MHRGEEGMPAHLATARAQAHRAALVGFGSLTLREVATHRQRRWTRLGTLGARRRRPRAAAAQGSCTVARRGCQLT